MLPVSRRQSSGSDVAFAARHVKIKLRGNNYRREDQKGDRGSGGLCFVSTSLPARRDQLVYQPETCIQVKRVPEMIALLIGYYLRRSCGELSEAAELSRLFGGIISVTHMAGLI